VLCCNVFCFPFTMLASLPYHTLFCSHFPY
jgi:hypothetical protein